MMQMTGSANYTSYKLFNTHYLAFWSAGAIDALNGHGFEMDTVTNSKLDSLFILNATGDGMNIKNCKNLLLNAVVSKENTGSGIEFVSGNDMIVFAGCGVENNGDSGLKLTATSDNIFIQNSLLKGNTGYGVNIVASTCDNVIITGNNFASNSTSAVNDSGTGTVIRGNVGVNDNASSSSGNVSIQTYAKEAITQNDAVYMVDGTTTYTNTYNNSGGYSGILTAFYSNSSTAFGSITDVSSTSQSLAVSGTNPMLIVDVRAGTGGSNDITSVTFNGVALTKVGEIQTPAARWNSTWVLNNPDVGTYTLAFNTAPDTAKATVYTDTGTISNKINSFGTINGTGTSIATIDVITGSSLVWLHHWTDHAVGGSTLSTNSGTVRYNDGVITVTDSNGEVAGPGAMRADASASGTANGFIGFANASASTNAVVSITIQGVIDTFSGLTIGSQYYLSDTTGAISTSAGTVTRKVGIAINTTKLLITNIW